MPTIYKVLGQSSPSATTDTTLYTVPASTQAVISTISICNRSSAQQSFRIAIRQNGATLANEQYVSYDTKIAANDTIALTLGITLGDTDIVTVRSSSADLSFNAFGSEIT